MHCPIYNLNGRNFTPFQVRCRNPRIMTRAVDSGNDVNTPLRVVETDQTSLSMAKDNEWPVFSMIRHET
jgi:hypothetical protein